MDGLALRRAERWAGAALALLVQAGFLALLVVSRPLIAPPEKLARELTLFLPRLPKIIEPAPRAAGIPGRKMPAGHCFGGGDGSVQRTGASARGI